MQGALSQKSICSAASSDLVYVRWAPVCALRGSSWDQALLAQVGIKSCWLKLGSGLVGSRERCGRRNETQACSTSWGRRHAPRLVCKSDVEVALLLIVVVLCHLHHLLAWQLGVSLPDNVAAFGTIVTCAVDWAPHLAVHCSMPFVS